MELAGENILVIKLGALGDFVQALGLMAAIRRRHPQSTITLLTTAPYRALAQASGYVDDIWIDSRPKWHHLRQWFLLRKKLNSIKFARVYDLQNSDRTAMYFRLLRVRPEWVGTAPGASHRNISPSRTAGHAFDGHIQTLALAGITDIDIDDMRWIETDTGRFDIPSPYVLIVPGSDPARPGKRWPSGFYGTLAQHVEKTGYTPVIIGTGAEADEAAAIKSLCPAALDLTDRTSLFDIVTLGRGAMAAIGNDTGPMHMIAPTGCPCCVLFSSESDPVKHAPRGAAVRTLQSEKLRDLPPSRVIEVFDDFRKNTA